MTSHLRQRARLAARLPVGSPWQKVPVTIQQKPGVRTLAEGHFLRVSAAHLFTCQQLGSFRGLHGEPGWLAAGSFAPRAAALPPSLLVALDDLPGDGEESAIPFWECPSSLRKVLIVGSRINGLYHNVVHTSTAARGRLSVRQRPHSPPPAPIGRRRTSSHPEETHVAQAARPVPRNAL